jgi:hypothetical protein
LQHEDYDMAVTAPEIASLVVYFQGSGHPTLTGGSASIPALVIRANGLVVLLKSFGAEGDHVATNVPHVSAAPLETGAHSWRWPDSSGNSNL